MRAPALRAPVLRGGACRDVRQSLTNSVDGGPIDLELRRHIRRCPACRRRLDEQRRLVGMLRLLESTVPPPPKVNRRARAAKRVMSGAGSLGIVSVAALVFRQARKRS